MDLVELYEMITKKQESFLLLLGFRICYGLPVEGGRDGKNRLVPSSAGTKIQLCGTSLKSEMSNKYSYRLQN